MMKEPAIRRSGRSLAPNVRTSLKTQLTDGYMGDTKALKVSVKTLQVNY